jgi:hypothetical protein
MIAHKIQPLEYVKISKGGGKDGLSFICTWCAPRRERQSERWQVEREL